jgi:RNA polymerase sigma-70 factor (ECF subfamily)
MSEADDWIRRYCRDGDGAAFRAFYRSQANRLWRFLVARGANTDAAYDLVAEAFLRFIQSTCRDTRAPVGLLYRIAINLQIDSYRHRQAAPFDPVIDPEGIGAEDPALEDDARRLRQLVTGLPAREQNLLLMRYWIGLSHKEVAAALGLPEGTVRRQSAALLKQLQQQWGER